MVNYKRLLFTCFAAAGIFISLLIHRVVRYWQLAVKIFSLVINSFCYHYPYKNWQEDYSNQQQLFCSLCEGLIASGKELNGFQFFQVVCKLYWTQLQGNGSFPVLRASVFGHIAISPFTFRKSFFRKIIQFFLFSRANVSLRRQSILKCQTFLWTKNKLSMEASLAFELQIP